MAPTVARRPDGAVLALGSPGAERIVTALVQVLLNFLRLRQPLAEAVAAPRLHVERLEQGWGVAVEQGLPVAAIGLPLRLFDEPSMFFGGAGAVLLEPDGALEAAADPRRQGGAAVIRPA
jgi:gamma-glutamyltranspeptidase/glutathione hydrolase